uniref:Eukaryotic translation initiation factor 3 subunit I n=8 Tax=Carnivora TaxID=33554 RepID=A0A8P0ND02_CANLF
MMKLRLKEDLATKLVESQILLQTWISYARERGHSETHLSIQEEGLHLLQQLPGPRPLMDLLQAGGGPLQQRLCATPQGGHQHQSQHLPWREMRVTLIPDKGPPAGPSPSRASFPPSATPTSLPRSPTPRVRLVGRKGPGGRVDGSGGPEIGDRAEIKFREGRRSGRGTPGRVWEAPKGVGPPTHQRTPPWQRRSGPLPGAKGRRPIIRKWRQSLFRSYSRCRFPRVNARMKPILLQGHERSITQIKYNREGDLLFTVAKDPIVNVWYSVNGERLGTYMGHSGAVWCVDADWDTKHVLTGSADNSCRLWDCETGKQLALLKTNSAVRTCGFDFGGNIIMFSTDKQMGYQCFVSFFDLRDPSQIDNNEPYMKIPCNDSKITSAVWGPLGECIIAGHEGGELNQYSAKSGEVLVNVKEHSRQINDIQLSRDMTMFVTASKDNTAKLFDSTTLEHQKTFRTERPVNSAALSPNYDHVVLGGGQEAMDVTTTSTRIGKFEARFFHLAFEEEFGRVKGHFGPINSVAFHPDGKSYSSGGEDGYVRIHYFDPQYFEFEFEA